MNNIVFDLGGVLLRWQPHEFMTRLAPQHAPTAEAGQAFAAAFFEGFGGDWGEFDRGGVEPAALAERIAGRIGISVDDARRVIDAVPDELQPIPATVALLRRLHARGHPLFFLSNMPAPYAAHLLASHAWFGLFRAGVFSSHIRLIKPEPAIFAHATEVFGIDPGATIFIDDVQANVDAARLAGWHGLWFQSPAGCEAELAALGLLTPEAETKAEADMERYSSKQADAIDDIPGASDEPADR